MARRTAAALLGGLVLAALAATASASAGRGRVISPLPSSAAVRPRADALAERRRRVLDLEKSLSKLPAGGTVAAALVTRRSSAVLAALESVPRGGALIDEDDDDDAGFVVAKLRNLVRSLLEVFDRSSPTLASIIRSFFGMVESFTGARLLPREKKKKSRKRGKKRGGGGSREAEESASSAGKKRRKSKRASVAEEEEESDSEDEVVVRKKKRAAAVGAKKKASGAALKKKAAAAGGGQASAHASKTLKSNNPNYRIQRELKEFLANPPPNLRVAVGKNIRVWIIHMTGTKGSIYEGEKYKLRVSFPPDYPTGPPSVYFLQPTPRHEHVYTNGDICLSLLGKDWRPTMTAQSLANSILSILSGAQRKSLPMDNARHAPNKPGGRQDDWIYHDDNC